MTKQSLLLLRGLMLVLIVPGLMAAVRCHGEDSWRAWAPGQEPAAVGTRVVENLLGRPKLDMANGLSYLETCSGYGAVRFAAEIHDRALLAKTISRYQAIITYNGAELCPKPDHVDNSVFGILPFELFEATGDRYYRKLGLIYADAQFAGLNADGLSSENRYYIDESYKIAVVQILAWRATRQAKYAQHAVAELTAFIDKSQQPGGLFFHGPDAHVYWGRGNGWMAAAMTEVLLYLPQTDPGRAKIMASYKAMMAGLLAVQAPDGRWRQVLNDKAAWEENSCTGYFIFAMGEGVDRGWIDGATYGPAVNKAWGALCGQIDDAGNVADVGVLTEHSNDEAYYLARPRAKGNLHGEFATIWAATALVGKAPWSANPPFHIRSAFGGN